ncbi:MAG: hypothetical protein KGQ37_01295 [Hyphomicrobiales bacterium]|nr:hypothetical protein [Hyphomicrobiales bacterium]
MNPGYIASAPPLYVLHGALALTSLVSGTAVMLVTKGTPRHAMLGRLFAGGMIATALTSFGIETAGHLSLIHILSIITLINIPLAIIMRRRGNIRGHAIAMVANYAGLVIAGGFAAVPPRLLGQVLFGH